MLLELYIPSGPSFKEFLLNYLYWVFLRVSIIIS
jgi:hypothetical protein